MKAWVLHNIGNIRLEEVPMPEIGENEVLVKVKAAGICGSDIPRIYTSGAYFYPLITGHEFSGQVEAAGKNADEKWIGKHVGVFPLIPCRDCVPCKNKQFEMCKKYSYLGSRRNGGFAEYVAVPKRNLIELPDNVSFEEAAMLEPMSVAVHAIRRVKPIAEETVVVCGLGTIGMLVVMFLIEKGIKNILVIGNKNFQYETVLKLGIKRENFCDIRTTDTDKWLDEKTSGNGAHVFFECVGKNDTINQAVNNTVAGGRIMLIGNPYGDVELDKATYWKILRNQLIVMGSWNSSFSEDNNDDCHYVLRKLKEGKIRPGEFISHKFDIEKLEKGLKIMRDKSESFLKIMVTT
ncbi:MAG: galactitol-1-phosphate 5-dehydrogenase [Ruminiclostridium sp.]|nr:galactitol-1-phosphate 5-dehydrogenase [Ruminiclostridium sp.]